MNGVSFESMIAKWPSSFVARSEVGKFSGGLLHPRTMANLDSLGEGPDGAVRLKKRVGYEVVPLVRWMEGRALRQGKRSGK